MNTLIQHPNDLKAANLSRLLRPRHIAFVGSIQAEGSIAACRRAGYKGEMWTVSPNRKEIGGIACVSRIEDLPQPPDAALLALSSDNTVRAAHELAKLGAGGAVCMAAGFAELNDHGTSLQNKLVAVAGNMVILGPNCMGMINLFDGAVVWGSDNYAEHPGDLGAAIISQSGAFLFGITNVEQAFPLGYAISTGNQAQISIADAIHGVLDDERVNAIGVYLEGLADGNALATACTRALAKGVPVLALKGGNTPAGAAVARGHTASMVVEQDVWRTYARRYGIVEVTSPKAMVEALKFLTVCGVPNGPRLSAVTYSGGLNGMIVSNAPALGIELPQPNAENTQRLVDRLPDTVPVANPLDLNLPFRSSTDISLQDVDALTDSFMDLTKDCADMAVMFIDIPRPGFGIDKPWLPSVEAMVLTHHRTGLPCALAGIFPDGLDVSLRKRLLESGVAPLAGYEDAMKAFATAAACASVMNRVGDCAPALMDLAGTPARGTPYMLDELDSKKLLENCGMPVPRRWAGYGTDASVAAVEMGFPVAVKILSQEIAHKDQIGGVKLNLESGEAINRAVEEISTAVAHVTKEPRFLIERMVENPESEFIIGLKRDTAMGLVLMIGRGGTDVEEKADFVTLLLPLEHGGMEEALECLHATHITEFRKAIESVIAFADRYANDIIELDVNPVIVTATGDAVAVDALAVFSSPEQNGV